MYNDSYSCFSILSENNVCGANTVEPGHIELRRETEIGSIYPGVVISERLQGKSNQTEMKNRSI